MPFNYNQTVGKVFIFPFLLGTVASRAASTTTTSSKEFRQTLKLWRLHSDDFDAGFVFQRVEMLSEETGHCSEVFQGCRGKHHHHHHQQQTDYTTTNEYMKIVFLSAVQCLVQDREDVNQSAEV